MQVFDVLSRIREVSPRLANALLNRLIPRLIPLASGLGVRVEELTPTRCVLAMPVMRRTRNQLGSMYFGAQMTLADLTVAVLLFHRFPPGPFGGVIKRVEADFRAKGKGRIRCVCEVPPEAIEALEAVRGNVEGKAEAWVPLQLLNRDAQVVTDVRFLVAVKRF